jgi:hypothetical protein
VFPARAAPPLVPGKDRSGGGGIFQQCFDRAADFRLLWRVVTSIAVEMIGGKIFRAIDDRITEGLFARD